METPMHTKVWDPTPGHAEPGATTPPDLSMSETPKTKSGGSVRRRWDETPKTERGAETSHSSWAETPKVDRLDDDSVRVKQAMLSKDSSAASKKRSRWDETPVGATPSGQMTPR